MLEKAVEQLGEYAYYSSLDGTQAEQEMRRSVPLLKVHGCWRKQREYTVWTFRQLEMDVIRLRIEDSRKWLQPKIRNRALLFLGFFTNWEYLNTILRECLPQEEPRSVIVVDPTELNNLKNKAASLYQVLQNFDFIHVAERAEVFLDKLRRAFSLMLLRRMLIEHDQADIADPAEFLEGAVVSDLCALRRDAHGVNSPLTKWCWRDSL
jgi:hypothetical protein